MKRSKKSPSVLILDLDNTLIHSLEPPKGDHENDGGAIDYVKEKYDVDPDFIINSKTYNYFIYKRPYVDQFLKYVTKIFDYVIIWSAGTDMYVKLIVNKLFKSAHVKKPYMTLTRSDCEIAEGGGCRKNMKLLKRRFSHKGITYDPKHILFIDDLPYKIKNLPTNRIYSIKSFDVDKNPFDNVLKSFARGSVCKRKSSTSNTGDLIVKCLPKRRTRMSKRDK